MQGHNMFGSSQEEGLRRGPWTLGEDNTLSHYISKHGEGRWNVLARCAGLKRTGKSCRLRWLNYLKPDIKRGNLTPQEQLLILELHSKLGNRWSKIAQHLPGRTDNEIKNYWRTRVQRQARQLNMESSSKRFLEAIRCLWAPRLLDQSEHSPPPSISDTTAMNRLNPVLTEPCNYDHHYHLQQQHEPIYSFKECSSSNHLLGFEPFDIATYNETQTLISDSNYYVETTLNQAPMGVGCGDMSALGCQVAEPDWLFNNNMGDGLWNMDDVTWKLDI